MWKYKINLVAGNISLSSVTSPIWRLWQPQERQRRKRNWATESPHFPLHKFTECSHITFPFIIHEHRMTENRDKNVPERFGEWKQLRLIRQANQIRYVEKISLLIRRQRKQKQKHIQLGSRWRVSVGRGFNMFCWYYARKVTNHSSRYIRTCPNFFRCPRLMWPALCSCLTPISTDNLWRIAQFPILRYETTMGQWIFIEIIVEQ